MVCQWQILFFSLTLRWFFYQISKKSFMKLFKERFEYCYSEKVLRSIFKMNYTFSIAPIQEGVSFSDHGG